MKNFILTLLFVTTAVTGFAQTEPYGPVPYKTLEQTIGETYVLIKLFPGDTNYELKDTKGNSLTLADTYKTFKLISLNRTGGEAHFKDSLGLDYIGDIVKEKMIPDLALKSDLDEARKLFLNKTLWLNVTKVNEGKNRVKGNFKEITGIRFDPVIITDISTGYVVQSPILFTFKTKTGEYGYVNLSISGTNNELNPEDAFNHYFLTKDPKLTYHFTPAVWQMVQAGYTEIGMPIDAFRLVMGFPKDIHTTQTAKGTTTQWVYGTDHQSYYYFTNGKLTAKQD